MQLGFPVFLSGKSAQDRTTNANGQGVARLDLSFQQPGCRPLRVDVPICNMTVATK